jgi:small subunit ribosomal protein S20
MPQKKVKRHPGAIKAHRQSVKRNVRNRLAKKVIRETSRAVWEAAKAKSGNVQELMATAASSLDKAAQSGTVHWKTAARRKSRLAKRVAALASAAA